MLDHTRLPCHAPWRLAKVQTRLTARLRQLPLRLLAHLPWQ